MINLDQPDTLTVQCSVGHQKHLELQTLYRYSICTFKTSINMLQKQKLFLVSISPIFEANEQTSPLHTSGGRKKNQLKTRLHLLTLFLFPPQTELCITIRNPERLEKGKPENSHQVSLLSVLQKLYSGLSIRLFKLPVSQLKTKTCE